MLYVQVSYIYDNDKQVQLFVLLAFATIYPIWYEYRQVMSEGWREYIKDAQNWMDISFIVLSFINIGFQDQVGPYHLGSKICMILLIICLILRSFFFLKMFNSMTHIVVMVWHVVLDLRDFLFLYLIFILIIS